MMVTQWRRMDLPGLVGRGWRQLGAVLAVCGLVVLGGPSGPALAAQELDMLLNTADGKTLRLTDLRGKVVLVNFWATWCPPCLEEIPELVRFQARYADKGVVVVGVDYMDQASHEQLLRFIAQHRINYPIVHGDAGKLGQLATALGGVFGLPVTKLLDRQGRLVSTQMGGVTEKGLRELVEPFLAATAVSQ
ncbi:MAG: TlpA family protein disulfide reductase [Magnetococcus sp. DMHC-8]